MIGCNFRGSHSSPNDEQRTMCKPSLDSRACVRPRLRITVGFDPSYMLRILYWFDPCLRADGSGCMYVFFRPPLFRLDGFALGGIMPQSGGPRVFGADKMIPRSQGHFSALRTPRPPKKGHESPRHDTSAMPGKHTLTRGY